MKNPFFTFPFLGVFSILVILGAGLLGGSRMFYELVDLNSEPWGDEDVVLMVSINCEP